MSEQHEAAQAEVTPEVTPEVPAATTETTPEAEVNPTYNLKSNAIRAARVALEERGIPKPMSEVHFRVFQNPITVEGEEPGWTWLTIDPSQGTVGGVAPPKEPKAAKEPKAKKAAKQDAEAKKAIKAADKAASADAPPPGSPLPYASENPAKDAEMPALRKNIKLMVLPAAKEVYSRRPGTKQALLVDLLSRPNGATFGEIWDACKATGKPWVAASIRSGLAWDTNHIAGYGITSEAFNGEQFADQGRGYEAQRLGFNKPGYDPEYRMLVYRLTYPEGQNAPLPHRLPEPTPRVAKEPKANGKAEGTSEATTEAPADEQA